MSTLLHRYLGRDMLLARLQDHAARLARLQRILETALPPQSAHACRAVNIKGEVLTISARGSAIAVRLKQTVPSLLAHFARAGIFLERIDIKVGLPDASLGQRASPARAISDAARAQIETFAASLPEDAPLRSALETLARRSRA